jgi:hypothetical protein
MALMFERLIKNSRMVAAGQLGVNFANNFDFIFLLIFERSVTVGAVVQTSHDVALAIHTGREMKLFPNGGACRRESWSEGLANQFYLKSSIYFGRRFNQTIFLLWLKPQDDVILPIVAGKKRCFLRAEFQSPAPETIWTGPSKSTLRTESHKAPRVCCLTSPRKVSKVSAVMWRGTPRSNQFPICGIGEICGYNTVSVDRPTLSLPGDSNIPRYSKNVGDVCRPQIGNRAENLSGLHC